MKKKMTLTEAKKKAWKKCSEYVRRRDKGVCFTCDKVIPNFYDRYGNLLEGWKSAHAGHWITAKNCGCELYLHEQNVHCQCYHCNINLSGNWLVYEKKIIERYGQKVCDDLKELKWKSKVKYKLADYERIHDYYKEKIDLLNNG